jgi:hypothetical protein
MLIDTKLRLANYRLYWRLKKHLQASRFQFSRRTFGARFVVAEKRKNLTLIGDFFRVSLLSLLLSVVTVAALYAIDNWFLVFPINIPTPSVDRYLAFLIGIAQVGGVFIGLYYAGITAVAGTVYAQMPASIRNLLVRQRTIGVYMEFLTFVTFLPIVLAVAASSFPGHAPRLGMPFVALVAGVGIIAFVQLGRRAYELLDPTSLSHSAFEELVYWTEQATIGGKHWSDQSFQKHSQKRAAEAIEILEILAEYSGRSENLRPESSIALVSNVLRYLNYYLDARSGIPTQSFWYERTLTHPDWFKSSDSTVQMAAKTGTTIRAQEVPVHTWVEDRLDPLIMRCFRANVSSANIPTLLQLSTLTRSYIAALSKAGDVRRGLLIVDSLAKVFFSTDAKEKISVPEMAGVADFIGHLLIQVLLSAADGTADRLPDKHQHRLRRVRWTKPKAIYTAGFPTTTLEQLEWLRERIANEHSIEGTRVTPDWYCLDMILLSELRAIRDTVPILLDIEQLFLKPARELSAEAPFAAAALLSRSMEYLSKLAYHIRRYEALYTSSLSARTLTDLPWPAISPENWKTTADQQYLLCIESVTRLIPLTLAHDKDEKLPDYRGQFIQFIADSLLSQIIEGKADIVAKLFPTFWASSYMLFEVLRPKTPPDAAHIVRAEIHVATAPIVDLMDLSGYALLLSEYHRNREMWSPVEKVWTNYLNGTPGALKQLAAIASLEHLPGQIPHRGIVRSQWSIQVHQLLRTLPGDAGTQSRFGMHRVLHPSALVRYVARDEFADGVEIFVGGFLSHFDGADSLDWGFHRPKDFLRGVEWETDNEGGTDE